MVISTPDILGPAIVAIISLLFAVSHRATSRDPYRNFMTQLIDGCYSNWHEPAERRRRLLRFASVGFFAMAAIAFGFALFAFLSR